MELTDEVKKGIWVHDIEMYRNLFFNGFKNPYTNEIRTFELSPRKNEKQQLIDFIRDNVKTAVGFMNQYYDYPLLHYYLTVLFNKNIRGRELVNTLKEYSNKLIENSNKQRGFVNNVYNPLFEIIDLLKIHHYDNKAKATSLKLLEFNMRMRNIQELPYHHETILTEEQIEEVCIYNINDLDATANFYLNSLQEIEIRRGLSNMYGINMMNYSDAKIGQEIFVKYIKEKLKIDKIGKTPREQIRLADTIFPYVGFSSPPFQTLLKWLKLQTVTEVKGAFTEIPFNRLEGLKPYYEVITKKGKQQNINVIYKDFRYDFGLGGIHGSVPAGIYESNDDYLIIDIDVSSYYPNLAIQNKLYPEHLSTDFCEVFNGVYIERQKHPKKSPPNLGLKLSLNAVFGKSNSEYSPFYDPKYTIQTTLNGQLLLCMIAERFCEEIPSVQILQINTDGLTVMLHKDYRDKFNEICKRWEKLTKLQLEEAQYKRMIIRDVNNYSAMYMDGSIKRKGLFTYKIGVLQEREWHKNHSMLIVPIALEKYFYENINVEEFVKNYIQKEEDVFDFFKRAKVDRRYRLVGRNFIKKDYTVYKNKDKVYTFNIEEAKTKRAKQIEITCIEREVELQRITRYYVANEGYSIIKLMPPLKDKIGDRETEIESGFQCMECNNLGDNFLEEIKNNINYDYYIEEINKIIRAIENHESSQYDESENDEINE